MQGSNLEDILKRDPITKYYHLQDEEIGHGMFSVVKMAIHLENGNEYAVKVIKKSQLSADDIKGLYSEVVILSQLSHPNVVILEEIYEDENYFYMVMEMLNGGNLQTRIENRINNANGMLFSEEEVVETLKPVIDALDYCHNMGIAHRDLKVRDWILVAVIRLVCRFLDIVVFCLFSAV